MKKQFLIAAVTFSMLAGINQSQAQWQLNGNAGTVSTNFIGTTDNVSLKFKTKNQSRMIITSGGNVGIGTTAPGYKLQVIGTGRFEDGVKIGGFGVVNVDAPGILAGRFKIDSAGNVGIGTPTPANKLTVVDGSVDVTGDYIVRNSLAPTTNYGLLTQTFGGGGNTHLDSYGTSDLYFNRFSLNAVSIGDLSTGTNFLSNGNVGIGILTPALKLEVAGDAKINGVVVGRGNGGITTNTAVGDGALNANTTGFNNTAVGNFALDFNTIGKNNTAVGIFALYSNLTGERNTSVGYQSLLNNVDGSFNSAFGSQALTKNTSGTNNTANGYKAMEANTTASNNTAFGFQALLSDTSGANNTAIGSGALMLDINGFNNTAIGFNALSANTTGSYNTATGKDALINNTTSTGNSAFGYQALKNDTTGINNTGLGTYADITKGGISNATAVGYLAKVDSSNKVKIGNGSVTSIGGQVSWTSFSDARIKDNVQENIHGLDFINALRPVTFHYNVDKENAMTGITNDENWEGKKDIEKIAFSGFLAQEVDAAAKKVGYDFSGVDKNGKILGLRYSEFVVPLVKGMQELSAENKATKADLEKTKLENEQLRQTLSEMKSCFEMLCENATTKNSAIHTVSETSMLFQNQPNPFSQSTVISFRLLANTTGAKIIIRNLDGEMVKTIGINQTGKGQVTLNASELTQGTYTYTLFANNQSVDTKLMIITK